MEYTVEKLARLSGVSGRTLRYYDSIGLLCPARGENGYRLYGPAQVDRLQEILFYRELGMPLEDIRAVLCAPAYDREHTLAAHLAALEAEQQRLVRLADTVRRTLAALKGEMTMTDQEKFEGFKRELVAKNEAAHGAEARAAYGDAAVDAVNARLQGMTDAQWAKALALEAQLDAALKAAVPQNRPDGPEAAALCALHRDWLLCYWTPEMYSKPAHAALGELYAADGRFRTHYDAICPGAADYLCAALAHWVKS